MLDEFLAHDLGEASLSATIQIDLCIQGKDHTWKPLETLTWTFSVECKTDTLEEFETDWYLGMQTFFYRMFKNWRKKEYKTVPDLFPDIRKEIDNLLAILSNSKDADLERGKAFCIELHRYTLPLQGPRRCDFAA